MPQKCRKSVRNLSQRGWCNKLTKLQFLSILTQKILMLSKRYKSTEVDLAVCVSVTPWPTSNDTQQVVEICIETSTKMYTPF